MVGRPLDAYYPPRSTEFGDVRLEVENHRGGSLLTFVTRDRPGVMAGIAGARPTTAHAAASAALTGAAENRTGAAGNVGAQVAKRARHRRDDRTDLRAEGIFADAEVTIRSPNLELIEEHGATAASFVPWIVICTVERSEEHTSELQSRC